MLPNSCTLCLLVVETNAHLFLHSSFSWRLWGKHFQLVNPSFTSWLWWLTSSLHGVCSNLGGPCGNCGSCVYTPSYGQFGKSITIVSLKSRWRFFLCMGSFLFFLSGWAKKDCILSHFSLCVVWNNSRDLFPIILNWSNHNFLLFLTGQPKI